MGEGLHLMLGDLRMHAGVTEPVFLIFALCVVTVFLIRLEESFCLGGFLQTNIRISESYDTFYFCNIDVSSGKS